MMSTFVLTKDTVSPASALERHTDATADELRFRDLHGALYLWELRYWRAKRMASRFLSCAFILLGLACGMLYGSVVANAADSAEPSA